MKYSPAHTQLDEDLARLGKSMSVGPTFVHRVMEKIDEPEHAARRPRWMPIGLSLAASFMLALGWIAISRRSSAPTPTIDDPSASLVRTSTEWQTVSERAIMLSGEVPAREISQQKFERLVWVDPHSHTTFERVVPREKCTFVTLVSY
jgi:hypothetical protein